MTRAVLAVAMLGACSSAGLLPPVVSVKTGPASSRPIKRIVAVPATCGTLGMAGLPPVDGHITYVPNTCDREAVAGADQIIRLGLAFRGLDVIDSEDVNVVTAKRIETQATEHSASSTGPESFSDRTEVERVGARFEDAPPLEQAAILAELRADAVLSARIWIGSSIGMSRRHVVIAQVQLLTTSDRALVWSRRCELEVAGLLETEAADIERATRCVMEGGT